MKARIILLILSISFIVSNAQNNNPYEEFGHKTNVVYETTVSDYLYIKNRDTTSQTKAIVFNIKEGVVLFLDNNDKILNKVTIQPEQLLHWLSVDPLANKYPSVSPYNFCSNNPIIYKDPDGGHNVIYLVDVQKNNTNKIDIHKIAEQSRANLKALGMETDVVIWDSKKNGGAINGKFIVKTDAIALIGSVEDIKKYARENEIETTKQMVIKGNGGFTDDPYFPEVTQGNCTLIDSDVLKETGKLLNNSKSSDVAAFLAVHGFGHTQGIPDQTSENVSFMGDANFQITKGPLSGSQNNVNDVFTKSDNKFTVDQININITGGDPSRKTPHDDYQLNKSLHEDLKK